METEGPLGARISHSSVFAENRLIPTELRREALALQGSLEFDDAGGEGEPTAQPSLTLSHVLPPTGALWPLPTPLWDMLGCS